MVMEAATLSSPQRKYNVVPVQKSLSLPSYARAGGEGIDHRLIFAALEQKEKVRRKSRIFTREKSARQNIFCLPIPSSAKCKETSLSSDTSCSSLEYQKPKPVTKPQKDDGKCSQEKSPSQNDTHLNETAIAKTSHPEINSNAVPIQRDGLAQNADSRDSEFNLSLKVSDHRRGHRSPSDTMRLNVGSSDSMDRSSRSSNDSLSRKERLVAIKARVEAAREKFRDSSSEEESRISITRYNSDGVIHRTVRDVKSKSSRSEKRLRRRSQDECAVKKANRKSNLSLCLNSENGDVKLDLGKPSLRTEDDVNNLEIKTDFCPSPNIADLMKKSYFSDYPSRENVARFVQARIRHIEDEERKRRSGSDFRERIGTPTRQSPQLFESNSPTTTENRRRIDEYNGSHINTSEKTTLVDTTARASPIPKLSQAPTPPPRSPKSITFVNKAFIQHQNASLLHQENSLERKSLLQQNHPAASYAKLFDQFNSKSETVISDPKYPADSLNAVSDKQKIRELISSRRKTCGNFDFVDKNIFSDLNTLDCSVSPNTVPSLNSNLSSVQQTKRIESKGYFSSSETHCTPTDEDPTAKFWKSKWQENEQRREFMFNSLESKRKCNPPSWLKWRNAPPEASHLFPNNKLSSTCNGEGNDIVKQHTSADVLALRLEGINRSHSKDISSLSVQYPSGRLSKSEVNIAFNDTIKSSAPEVKERLSSNSLFQAYQGALAGNSPSKSNFPDKTTATANLESAMEELESVYQSLKISSDNLSDKNSVSNIIGSDDMSKPKYSYNSGNTNVGYKRRSSVCESSMSSKNDFHDLTTRDDRMYHKYVKPCVFTALNDSVPVSNEKPSDQFSIDELFNDLTQQLDLEQKLLKEPRDNRSQQPKVCCQANRFHSSRHLNQGTSQISIRREFYDNLCKNNLDQSKKIHPVVNECITTNPQPAISKKKYKAVRSLSENISHLMATANSNPALTKTGALINNSDAEDNILKTTTIEQYYERVRDPANTDAKSDLVPKASNMVSNVDYGYKTQNSKLEEIRHIRVSMDTNNFQPKPVEKDTFSTPKQFARLSSAVCSSQLSPRHTAPKPCFPEKPSTTCNSKDANILDETGVGKLLSSLLVDDPERLSSNVRMNKESSPTRHCFQEIPPTNYNSKESNDVLEEGLETLLNRLLGETPDRQQSSLLQSKDPRPPTPPPVAPGEMRVMQHLDVLRLKPVPT